MSSEKLTAPWLPVACAVVSLVTTVGGGVWMAATRDADLRHIQAEQLTLEKRVESLELYRGDMREVLAVFREDVKRTREDIAEIKRMLRGGSIRAANHE